MSWLFRYLERWVVLLLSSYSSVGRLQCHRQQVVDSASYIIQPLSSVTRQFAGVCDRALQDQLDLVGSPDWKVLRLPWKQFTSFLPHWVYWKHSCANDGLFFSYFGGIIAFNKMVGVFFVFFFLCVWFFCYFLKILELVRIVKRAE